jgi:hypothetical protein
MAARLRLLRLSTLQLAGRRFWVLPLLPVLWPLVSRLFLQLGWREEAFTPTELIPSLIGLPLSILGIALGVRIIASEIDQRTVEIAYTVPGGASRLWTYKLAGAALLLAAAEAISAAFVWLFVTDTPPDALLASFLAGAFHLSLAMWLSVLFRSEVTGALACVPVLLITLLASELAVSPMFNPLVLERAGRLAPEAILARTVQNRIGISLAIAALVLLAYDRAERREKVLSA